MKTQFCFIFLIKTESKENIFNFFFLICTIIFLMSSAALLIHIKIFTIFKNLNHSNDQSLQKERKNKHLKFEIFISTLINFLPWMILFIGFVIYFFFRLIFLMFLIFEGFFVISKIEIKDYIYSWIIVVVLPINSILSPTFFVLKLIKKKKKRKLYLKLQKM